MINIVKARVALGNLMISPDYPENLLGEIQALHDALLAEERKNPAAQAKAFAAIAGPRSDWEIA
jgi:hypothetical protein